MRWSPGDRSNIEDMRGRSGGRVATVGIGGFLVVLALSWLTGTNLFSLLDTDSSVPTETSGTAGSTPTSPAEERMVDFVDAVMRDAQSTWSQILGNRYQPTRVVLFRDAVDSACGSAQSATGPFYCPSDQKVYLDLGFFSELDQRFGAPGDFAQAYVITHELGHHVQNLLGFTERAQQDRRSGPTSASVALELQADCFAGIWGHAAAQSGRFQAGGVELEPGDADEALRAAA
jgi:predicted metalloprotease